MAKKDKGTRSRVYKRIDLVGTSNQGFEQAIENAVQRASETISDLRWFEVTEMRGAIQNGKISEYQVLVTVSFEVR
jgi:flavin-binding protein dodecin